MTKDQGRLFGSGRRRIGRNRRSFDRYAKHVRQTVPGGTDPVVEDELQTLRDLADQLDGMETDPDSSPHTFAMVARTYADLRRELTRRLPASATTDPLRDALTSAIRDSAQT